MFTGLIKEIATVIDFSSNLLTLKAKYKPNLGDSIAVNGACLTVMDIQKEQFSVELSPESLQTLAIENYKNKVHIEPAMMMKDRFEGHVVQGHVDCIGEIENILNNGTSSDFFIKIPKEYIKFVSSKGSIAIDGISLTINDVFVKTNEIRLTIIPYTLKNTLFLNYKINSKVNIETDIFARYIYNLINKDNNSDSLDTWAKIDSQLSIW